MNQIWGENQSRCGEFSIFLKILTLHELTIFFYSTLKTLFSVLFLFFSVLITAQNKVSSQNDLDSIRKNSFYLNASDSQKIESLIKLVSKYRYTKASKVFVDEAMTISLKSNNNKNLATAYYLKGNYDFFNSSLDTSLFDLDKSLMFLLETKNSLVKASVLTIKGGIFKKRGDVSKGISFLLEAKKNLDEIDTLSLSTYEKNKIKGQYLVVHNSLANFYNEMEDYKEALLYYDLAYASSLKMNSKINSAVILSNKGDLLLNLDRNEEALQILLQSKKLKIEGNAPKRLLAGSDLNIGLAYNKLGDFDKSLFYLNKSTSLYESIDNKSGLIYTYTYRGILYNVLKKYDLARIDCEQAKILATKYEDLEYISKSCKCLYTTYKELGDFNRSLGYHEMYIKTKDSIFNEKNIKKRTQLQMQYVFDKQQELQKIEIEKKDQQRKFYLFLSLAGLIIAALLGFFYFKNRKKNILLEKQKKMLEVTVDEKNVLLKETHHRVKNSFQIVSSLLYLQSENITDQEAQLAIKEAQNRVRSMVLIHQKLYSKDQLVGIDTKDYFTDLVNDIIESHQFKKNPISYQLDVDSMILNIETITPLGLILNEMIVNVLKHAFETIDETSKMNISFKKEGDSLLLKVKDNGKGLKEEVNDTSFGIKLIKALARKLKANLIVKNISEGGTIASLEVKRFEVL